MKHTWVPCYVAASIRVAAAIPNLFMLALQPPVFELANSLLAEPLVCEQGYYHLPDRIRIDEMKLKAAQS
jgi:L-alanine-DL-glutamate epimerase-like enolase superfamily enzyme